MMAFFVQCAKCAYRLTIGEDFNTKLPSQKINSTDGRQKQTPLTAAWTIVFRKFSKTLRGHSVTESPFNRRQWSRPGHNADKNPASDGGATGSMESTESAFYIFGSFPRFSDRFRLFFRRKALLIEVGCKENCRNQKMMLRAMHLNGWIIH